MKLLDFIPLFYGLLILSLFVYFAWQYILDRVRWPLRMSRSLSDLPPIVVPNGYRLRPFQAGGEDNWLRLVNTAFATEKRLSAGICRSAFEMEFSKDSGMKREWILFVEQAVGGELVGTIAAMEGEFKWRWTGRVAWIAVHPAHRKRGIGSALLTAALHAMRERGLTEAMLITNPALAASVRLYERHGLVPVNRRGAARAPREATPCG